MDIGTIHIQQRLYDDPLGTLHEGLDRQTKKRVFVYLPQVPDRTAPEPIVTRLESVARTLAEPPIPGLVAIGSCGVHDATTPYIVMPFVKGTTLEEALAARQKLPDGPARILPDALPIGRALAITLLAAHGRGQFHLALSPSQVILPTDAALRNQSMALVRGIGIARVTGQHRATRWQPAFQAYASPEQLSAERSAVAQANSDVYSLGVLLFHMLSGRSPNAQAATAAKKSYDPEQNPSTIVYQDVTLPGDLSMLLMRMLSVVPAERPSLQEVVERLKAPDSEREQVETIPFRRLAALPGAAAGPPARSSGAISVREAAAGPVAPAAKPLPSPPAPNPSPQVSAPLPASGGAKPDPHIGTLFGNFKAVRKIGEGGMGTVYEAEHQTIGRRAAVKILHRHIAQNEQYAKRFLNEARSVNIVQHPGLVEIFEYGQLPDGTLYIVMEFLAGENLYARMTRVGGAFPPREAMYLGQLVARALTAAHNKGIVHRDLKPENIMLIPNPVNPTKDWVKILDFGIAKMENQQEPKTASEPSMVRTKIGAFLGTPLYMAPEQHGRAEQVDGKADVFALGVILYELLAGEPPFEGNSLTLLSRSAIPLDKQKRALPRPLIDLVQKMIAAKATERPSMEEVSAALDALLPTPVQGRPRLSRPQLIAVVAAAAAGLLVLAVILAVALRSGPRVNLGQARLHALKAVKELLRSPDAELQVRAIAAVGQSRDVEYQSLIQPLLSSADQNVVISAAQALGQLNALTAQPALLAITKRNPVVQVRIAAAGALLRMQHPRGQEALAEILEQSDEVSQIEAALLLLEHGEQTGSTLLWRYVERGQVPDDSLIKILGPLARVGDEQARRRLSEQLAKSSASAARLFMASTLARLGDEPARAVLLQALNQSGMNEERLLAARILSSLGESVDPALFIKVIQNPGLPDAERALATQGLADGGQTVGVHELDAVLEAPGTSDRLRMAAAGAVLQIAAGEPAQLAEQSLNWAQAAVSSDGVSTRQTAVLFLGELDSDKTITPLRVALKDREREVRRGAARALGKKNARIALDALTDALDDADTEVRAIGMQSIGQVASALRKRGSKDSDQFVLGRLEKMTHSLNEVDRVVASGTLLQLGDQQQKARVNAGLSSKDPLVRRLAVEMISHDLDLFQVALQDSDRVVRLAAARRLAAQGSHAGANVLRAIVTGGDMDGLIAYGVLKKLGEPTPPPPDLVGLLSSGDLTTRSSVLAASGELPDELALRLLQEASMDPSAVIRRKAAELAAERFRISRRTPFLHIVRTLRNDSEVIVRSRSSELVEQFGKDQTDRPAEEVKPPPKPTDDADAGAGANRPEEAVAKVGLLHLVGEDSVRYQIDKGPTQYVSDKPVSVPGGKHRLLFASGAQEVVVTIGATVEVKVPISLAEQTLQDGTEAVNKKEYARAQELFERVHRLISRGRVKGPVQAELLYQQGRLFEARERWPDAIQSYTRYTNLPSSQQRSETLAAARAAMSRLSSRMGRIQIFTLKDGRCQLTQELFLAPNERHIINLGKGQSKEVRAQAGVVTAVRQCQ